MSMNTRATMVLGIIAGLLLPLSAVAKVDLLLAAAGEAELAPVRALAETMPQHPRGGLNISAAVRRAVAEWHAYRTREPLVSISAAGADRLDQLATEAGVTRDEVVRLALRYAVQHAPAWLPNPTEGRPPK